MKVRISLLVAVGDLRWDRNLRFVQRRVYAILVGIQSSFDSALVATIGRTLIRPSRRSERDSG
jgi:hypothetical protein